MSDPNVIGWGADSVPAAEDKNSPYTQDDYTQDEYTHDDTVEQSDSPPRGQSQPTHLKPKPQRAPDISVTGFRAKKLAATIAYHARNGECPRLLAITPSEVNEAVKAIAIARSFISGNWIDLVTWPKTTLRRHPINNTSCETIIFRIQKKPLCSRKFHFAKSDTFDLKVANGSQPNVVAGAIAKRARGWQRITTVSLGPPAIFNAVKSICYARKYLEENALDVSFSPEFVTLSFESRDSSALKFTCFIHQI